MTSILIQKKLGCTYKSALTLKRRIQLFASETLPRMQTKFYEDTYKEYVNWKFPTNRNTDLTEKITGHNIPQADTVVLYSCRATSNKGRKRYKRTGQTASIYMSQSLGGEQRGTLVNVLGVKQGPVFYNSIANQKAATINPIIRDLIPYNAPLFTDMGYQGYPGPNHRMVNHSKRSPDKRYRWAQDRWSYNGITSNVAEGNNNTLKRSFKAYVWIKPKYSQLYLNEFCFIRNLKHFDLDVLLPEESRTQPRTWGV